MKAMSTQKWQLALYGAILVEAYLIQLPLTCLGAVAYAKEGRGTNSERDGEVDDYFRGSLVRTDLVPPTGEENLPGPTAGEGQEEALDPFNDLGVPGNGPGESEAEAESEGGEAEAEAEAESESEGGEAEAEAESEAESESEGEDDHTNRSGGGDDTNPGGGGNEDGFDNPGCEHSGQCG